MISLTPELCRAARALLSWGQRELAARSGVSHATIAAFELGERKPYGRTLKELAEAFDAGGVHFIEPELGVHTAGLSLKWDYEPPIRGADEKATTTQSDAGGGLSAFTDEEREILLKYYQGRPEAWAGLHEVSREALLQAMGREAL